MANNAPKRFLPFVNNDTPLEVVYKKLQEGGSGVAPELLLGVLSVILVNGVEDVKHELSSFTAGEWSERFQAFMDVHSDLKIASKTLKVLQLVNSHTSETDWSEMTLKDVHSIELIFLYSRKLSGSYEKELENALGPFNLLSKIQQFNMNTETFTEGRLFSSKGEEFTVSTKTELRAFIFYRKFIRQDYADAVKVVFNSEEVPF